MTRIGVTIDCNDLTTMTNFWCAALGYRMGGLDAQYQWIEDPDSEGPGIILQQVPEPRNGKNRLHLDLYANDIEHEVRRLQSLGARRIDPVPIEEAYRQRLLRSLTAMGAARMFSNCPRLRSSERRM